jgi:hypothetical protein
LIPGGPTQGLHLDRISTSPGGAALATGQGCVANSPVTVSVAGTTVASTTADATGAFSTDLPLNLPVGHYAVTAQCGVTLTTAIDVVLSSTADTPTSTAAVLLILLLLILGLLRSQLSYR